MQKWPPLYKRSSTGKEQEWTIHVCSNVDETEAEIVVSYGQIDGKKQTSTVRITEGKNLGKKNETSPTAQATFEAHAKWKKQKDKGYSEERGGGCMLLKPMLAHKYEDHKDKVVFPSWLQPKLDGVRAIAIREGDQIRLVSRLGKEHVGLAHIRAELLKLMNDGEAWDGELYVHGMTFQELVSLVKKDQEGSIKVEYHVYDKINDSAFYTRFGDVVNAVPDDTSCVKTVVTKYITTHEQVELFHELFVEDGYEGVMLRVKECDYKQGYRSSQLLKVKSFKTDEFKIVDVVNGIGKMENQGIFVCETAAGELFTAKPKGRDSLREEYLANKSKYIGLMLTVRYFSMTDSEKPVPRFPIGVSVRDYE